MYEIIGILLSGTLDPMPHTKGKDFLEICPEALAKDEKRILNTHLHDRFLPKVAFEKASESRYYIEETRILAFVIDDKDIYSSISGAILTKGINKKSA